MSDPMPTPPRPRPDNRPRPANPNGPKAPPRQEREDATTARIREYAARLVAEAPPLTPEQEARLAVLFATPERRARAA